MVRAKLVPLAAIYTSILGAALTAQTNYGSAPVGASRLSVSGGNTPISSPYVHADTAHLVVENISLAGAELTLDFSNGQFEASELAPDRYPGYYLEVIKEGQFLGMYFDIEANTEGSLTITTWDDPSQPVEVGDTVIVRKHLTVGEFFAAAESSLVPYADSVKFFEAGNVSYSLLWDGTKWTRDFVNDDSSWPIYPGQGFVCIFAQDIDFVVTGHVKTTPTQVPVYNGSNNFVGTLSPIASDFDTLGVSAWMLPYADSFKFLSNDGTLSAGATYIYDGTKVTPDFLTDAGTVPIAPHEAFLLLPASDLNWPVPPAYSVTE
jgi:hypothetical protein